MNDLKSRFLVVPPLMAAMLASLWVGGFLFKAAVIVLATACWLEIVDLLRRRGRRDASQGGGAALLIGSVGGSIYCVLGSGSLIVLRSEHGFEATLLVLVTVWIFDCCGYFFGRWLQGPKLWPAVSPSKTWSGFISGVLGVACLGLGVAVVGDRPWLPVLLFVVVIGLAGQLGDLAESKFKRWCGAGDSGSLLLGHGGFLDRSDSIYSASLAALLCLSALGASFP